eukprot:Hpha_TRINITY_DN16867_c1_g3::TRINITY_DN16867_c1_g3_i1::g.149125::m.149125
MAEITTDPTTGLRLIDVPPEHKVKFRDLEGSVLHYFGPVTKLNRKFKEQPRLLIIGYSCLYMCTADGDITRCVEIKDISEVKIDSKYPRHVALAVEPPDYDLLFQMPNAQEYANVTGIMDKIRIAQTDAPIPRRELHGSSLTDAGVMNLAKPPSWRLHWVPTTSKAKLAASVAGGGLRGPPGLPEEEQESENRALVYEEFQRVKETLKDEVQHVGAEQYESLAKEVELAMEMLDDRDRELARLRSQMRTFHDDPEIWRLCPNCRDREMRGTEEVNEREIHALERKLEDCEHLIDHLQLSRANAVGPRAQQEQRGYSESTQLIRLRREFDEAAGRVQELRRVIVESPASYPSAESRREGIARSGMPPNKVSVREAEARLRRRVDTLDQAGAEKDRELRQAKDLMKESLRRQVQELDRLRAEFDQYDTQVVGYLEDVFAGRCWPPGAAPGQTPRELATVTAAAARSVAVPPVVQQSAFTELMLGDERSGAPSPLDHRGGSAPPSSSVPLDIRTPAVTGDQPLFYQLPDTGGYDRSAGSPPLRSWLGSHLSPISEGNRRPAPAVVTPGAFGSARPGQPTRTRSSIL